MSSQNDNQKIITEIEAIHAEYMVQIKKLHDEQNEIITDFIKMLEGKKIDSIHDIINNA